MPNDGRQTKRKKDRVIDSKNTAAFFLGACNNVMRSFLVLTACIVFGFLLGLGSAVFSMNAKCMQQDKRGIVDGIVRLMDQRRQIDKDIEDQLNDFIKRSAFDDRQLCTNLHHYIEHNVR